MVNFPSSSLHFPGGNAFYLAKFEQTKDYPLQYRPPKIFAVTPGNKNIVDESDSRH